MAFVTEKQDGAATTPVLNVEELHSIKVADADNFPYFASVKVTSNVSCSTEQTAVFELVNGGKQELTSLKYEVEVWGVTTQYSWEGSLPSHEKITIEEELNIYKRYIDFIQGYNPNILELYCGSGATSLYIQNLQVCNRSAKF